MNVSQLLPSRHEYEQEPVRTVIVETDSWDPHPAVSQPLQPRCRPAFPAAADSVSCVGKCRRLEQSYSVTQKHTAGDTHYR